MKKIIVFLLIFTFAFSLASCADTGDNGTSEETVSEEAVYTASEAAQAMVSKLSFDGDLELSETPFNTLEKYDVDTSGITDIAWYVGSGAAADELAVIKCASEETFKSVEDAVNARIEYLKEGYSDYGPDQVPKIENACVKGYSNEVLVYCICSDSSEAGNMADEMFG